MKRLSSSRAESVESIEHKAWTTRGARLIGIVATCLIAASTPAVFAQTDLNTVQFQPPSGQDTWLRADFFLPQADSVQEPINVTVNGTPLASSSVTFTPTEKLLKYSCAVLLLVDNTLGNRQGINQKTRENLLSSVRASLKNFTNAAEIPPYNLEIATISDGNVAVLATMGSKADLLNGAIKKIAFDSQSPQLYLELKEAVTKFSSISADRKFLVIMSDGVSNDLQNAATAADVIAAAQKANVHICSIGFPPSAGSNTAQSLAPLAEQTGGSSVQAEGAKFELPKNIEDSLLKMMASGGQIQVNLAGLTAPVNLSFGIQTQLSRRYAFNYKLDSLPAAATPTPSPTVSPSSSTPTPPPTPAPTPASVLDQTKSWLAKNSILASAAGVALLAALAFLLLLLRRPANGSVPDTDLTQPNPEVSLPDPEPESAPLGWLESLDSEARYPINKTAVRIGRQPDNDIVMKNDSVSGYHAQILVRDSEFTITDLDSSNHVFVGGKQVHSTGLHDGDVIEFGEVRVRFFQGPEEDRNYPGKTALPDRDNRTKIIE